MTASLPPGAKPGDVRDRLALPAVALFVLGGLVIAAVLTIVTRDQDRAVRESEERTVAAVQEQATLEIRRLTQDYAVWDDAVRNLVTAFDPGWADDNVGPYLTRAFQVDATVVVEGRNRVRYLVVDGAVLPTAETDILPAPLRPLVEQARSSAAAEATDGVVWWNDSLYFVAAGRIAPEAPDRPASADPRAVLVLAKKLDTAFLPFLAERLRLAEVRVQRPDRPRLGATVPITDASRAVLAVVTWRPQMPGEQVRIVLLPLLAVAALAMAGVLSLLLTRVEATVRTLERLQRPQ